MSLYNFLRFTHTPTHETGLISVVKLLIMFHKCLTELLLSCLTGSWLPSTRADRPVWWCNIPIRQQWWCSRRSWLPGHTACTRWHRGREECAAQRGVHLHRQKDCPVHRKPHMGGYQRILCGLLRYVEENIYLDMWRKILMLYANK